MGSVLALLRELKQQGPDAYDPLAYHPFTEKPSHGSYLGCALTVVLIVGWLGMGGFFLSRLVQNDIIVSDATYAWDPAAVYTAPQLSAAFFVDGRPYFNESVVYFKFEQGYYTNQGASKQNTPIQTVPCLAGVPGTATAGSCPGRRGQMQGLFTDSVYQFIRVALLPCTSAYRNDCAPASVINDLMFNDAHDRSADLFFLNDVDQTISYWAPVYVTFAVPPNVVRKQEVYFLPREVVRRGQLLGSSSYELIQFDRFEARTEPYRGGAFLNFYVRISEARVIETQTPQLFLDFLKSVGGAFTVLTLVFATAGQLYNKCKFQRRLKRFEERQAALAEAGCVTFDLGDRNLAAAVARVERKLRIPREALNFLVAVSKPHVHDPSQEKAADAGISALVAASALQTTAHAVSLDHGTPQGRTPSRLAATSSTHDYDGTATREVELEDIFICEGH